MIVAVLVGCLVGAGLLLVLLRLAPPRVAPLVQLGRFDHAQGGPPPVAAGATFSTGAGGLSRRQESLGRWLSRQLLRRDVRYTSLRQDLALTGRSFEQTLGRKVTFAVLGALMALFGAAAISQLGFGLPTGAAAVLAVALAALFFVLPDIDARREAQVRREEFRKSLGKYLDLVALEMAGSAAPAEALPSAARIGSGWPLALIRATIFRARRAGRSPWLALADLGDRIGVRELQDLGKLISLVAQDGARVRSTLTARAQTMRRRELADLQVKAGKADQSLRITQITIGLGFVLFLGYPAVVAVLSI